MNGGVGGQRERRRRDRRLALVRRLGGVFRLGTFAAAAAVVAIATGIVYLLLRGGAASIGSFGVGFLTSSAWNTAAGSFGAAPALAGTLLTSGLAVLLALPVALGVALFGSEFAPARLRRPIAYVVDLGAAIPSVVYGFWALEVVVPFFRDRLEPALAAAPVVRPLFTGPILGTDVLTASVVVAVMIVPTIAALSREALRQVPSSQREAALGLGATRWEASRLTVLGSAAPGILGATVLGLGRAIGETIAVALVIGNVYQSPGALVAPSTTIPSWLVSRFTESTGLERSALYELALFLLVISLVVNLVARLAIHRLGRPRTFRFRARRRTRLRRPAVPAVETASRGDLPGGPAGPGRARAFRLRRRRLVEAAVVGLVVGAVVLAVVPLASLLDRAVVGGGSAFVTPSFYTSQPPAACGLHSPGGCPLGGIGPEIEGSLVLLGLSAAFGLPTGLLAGIYLAEHGRRRWGTTVGVLVDSLLGLPSILIGVFVFAVFLRLDRPDTQSTLSGAAALAVLMVPIVARATETALRAVPQAVREGALALGFPRHRVTLRVVLGSARGPLVTANLLAVMRAGGEAAALLLTAGSSTYWMTGLRGPAPALAPFIYQALVDFTGSPNYATDAWGAALVLLVLMGATSLAARLVLDRSRAAGAG